MFKKQSISKKERGGVWDWLLLLVFILVVLRIFLFPIVTIKGHSMEPNLGNGTFVVTAKYYDIERGDIITMTDKYSDGNIIIKRVIAKEGDTFELSGTQLKVNGKVMAEDYLIDYPKGSQYNILYTGDETKAIQQIVDGEYSGIKYEMKDNTLTMVGKVPKGKLFVLGDNRVISKDSRQIGYVDEKEVLGKYLFTIH